METVLAIFADIDDPRDHTAQYDLAALLFIALAATLCGARNCVDIADFAATSRADLAEFVDLPADATPSHDTFSRMFRLLDPAQLEDTGEHKASADFVWVARVRSEIGRLPCAGRGSLRTVFKSKAPAS